MLALYGSYTNIKIKYLVMFASSLIWNVEVRYSYLNSYDLDLKQYPLVELAQKLNHGTILLLELKLNPKPWKKMSNIGSSSLNKQVGFF
jgi:hypothetical protein